MNYPSIRYVDVIGDVHGCFDELLILLKNLDYHEENGIYRHPDGRKLVFVGDLCDRGPKSLEVIKLVHRNVEAQFAFQCPGNHDDKLMRWCQGRRVQVKHGLETTVAEIEQSQDPIKTKQWVEYYLRELPIYLLFDEGKLIVAHAGIREEMIGRRDKRVREVCLYGFPTGKIDQNGLPERDPVPKHYHGKALLVHGHTPVYEPDWEGNVLNIDTGCVFGGKLTCFRYPEKEFMFVRAKTIYGQSKRFPLP